MARRLVVLVILVPFISVALTVLAFYLLQTSALVGDREIATAPLEVGQSYGFALIGPLNGHLVGQVKEKARGGWIQIEVQDKNELTGRVIWIHVRNITAIVLLSSEDLEKLRNPDVPVAGALYP